MAAPRLCETVDNLPNSANIAEDLELIKILISNLNRQTLKESVGNISFNVIFECLDTENEEQLVACCDVLDRLLGAVDPSLLLDQFHSDLFHGLGHKAHSVQRLCLRQTQRVAETDPQALSSHGDILTQVVSVIGRESLFIAKQAAVVLVLLAQSATTLESLFQNGPVDALHALAGGSDDVRFRMYELVTDISRLSADSLRVCSSSGLLQKLVNEVHKDDILVQLNTIELLARLAVVPHGLPYMEEQGIVGKLDQMLQNIHEDPMTGFLTPALVKFFGGVAAQQPKEVCRRHPNFLPLVFSMGEEGESGSGALSCETVGLIASSVEGKRVLEVHGQQMRSACKVMGSLLKDSSNDVKVRILGAMENLLRLPVSDQTTDLLALTQNWYHSFSADPMSAFMDVLEKPFNEVRCGVYRVLLSMASQPWGQAALRDHASFSEFLLNRGTETVKDGKELKFLIARELVESPTAMEVMGRVYFVKLKEYVREGPFFVLAESAVAMESGE